MATGRSAFLINTARPDLAVSNIFVVAEGGVRVTSSGLVDTDYVEIQKQTSPAAGSFAAVWTPVVRQGQAVRLSKNNIEHIELITGVYRVVFEGADASALVVYMSEDQALLDSKLIYSYPAYNPNFNGAVTGTNLSPALVSSRDRIGHWTYDILENDYVWVESLLDTSTGTVTHEFYDQPGGGIVVPGKLISQPLDYPSCERMQFFEIDGTPESGNESFLLSVIDPAERPKKIRVKVDTGSFTLLGQNDSGIVVLPADGWLEFTITSPMGHFEFDGQEYFSLVPVTGAGDTARVIVQTCHVSPACLVVGGGV